MDGCVPLAACPSGMNCGTYPDGCGGMLDCGTCQPPLVCSTNNICVSVSDACACTDGGSDGGGDGGSSHGGDGGSSQSDGGSDGGGDGGSSHGGDGGSSQSDSGSDGGGDSGSSQGGDGGSSDGGVHVPAVPATFVVGFAFLLGLGGVMADRRARSRRHCG
jgi:hypothetical protein